MMGHVELLTQACAPSLLWLISDHRVSETYLKLGVSPRDTTTLSAGHLGSNPDAQAASGGACRAKYPEKKEMHMERRLARSAISIWRGSCKGSTRTNPTVLVQSDGFAGHPTVQKTVGFNPTRHFSSSPFDDNVIFFVRPAVTDGECFVKKRSEFVREGVRDQHARLESIWAILVVEIMAQRSHNRDRDHTDKILRKLDRMALSGTSKRADGAS
ncbi:hypothetical protein BKA70DRAFT_1515191 [Coprinopsis sp. MPI-PUGE-AT-0042]|nr:hypothetical protein BKA70DRAFT_1515191 [Coprinopsis sp. MPI-PUGE-AT-0042]